MSNHYYIKRNRGLQFVFNCYSFSSHPFCQLTASSKENAPFSLLTSLTHSPRKRSSDTGSMLLFARSEERRVGKEGGVQGWASHVQNSESMVDECGTTHVCATEKA